MVVERRDLKVDQVTKEYRVTLDSRDLMEHLEDL